MSAYWLAQSMEVATLALIYHKELWREVSAYGNSLRAAYLRGMMIKYHELAEDYLERS